MEWRSFLKKFYEERHRKNPDYKFSQAMKDAAGPYHKQQRGGGGGGGSIHIKPSHLMKIRGGSRKRKNSYSRRSKGRSRKH